MNINTKILQKILANKFNDTFKRSYTMVKLVSFHGYKDSSTYINAHNHLNRCRNVFDKIQHPYVINAMKNRKNAPTAYVMNLLLHYIKWGKTEIIFSKT
jgi:hypothetical protein